jgi:hypothetical protein
VVGHWTNKLYEYFEAEQKRLQCTLQGGVCAEPESKYESFHKTMLAARERARKTSILGGSAAASATSDNNNQGFINLGGDLNEESVMSEAEKSLRARMRKRDAMMRYNYNKIISPVY